MAVIIFPTSKLMELKTPVFWQLHIFPHPLRQIVITQIVCSVSIRRSLNSTTGRGVLPPDGSAGGV